LPPGLVAALRARRECSVVGAERLGGRRRRDRRGRRPRPPGRRRAPLRRVRGATSVSGDAGWCTGVGRRTPGGAQALGEGRRVGHRRLAKDAERAAAKRGKSAAPRRIFHKTHAQRDNRGKSNGARRIFHGLHAQSRRRRCTLAPDLWKTERGGARVRARTAAEWAAARREGISPLAAAASYRAQPHAAYPRSALRCERRGCPSDPTPTRAAQRQARAGRTRRTRSPPLRPPAATDSSPSTLGSG
jgi:hypothetical protein